MGRTGKKGKKNKWRNRKQSSQMRQNPPTLGPHLDIFRRRLQDLSESITSHLHLLVPVYFTTAMAQSTAMAATDRKTTREADLVMGVSSCTVIPTISTNSNDNSTDEQQQYRLKTKRRTTLLPQTTFLPLLCEEAAAPLPTEQPRILVAHVYNGRDGAAVHERALGCPQVRPESWMWIVSRRMVPRQAPGAGKDYAKRS